MGRLLEKFLERQQLDSGVLFYRIRELWRDVVGPVSAARSVPSTLRDQVLTVAVADSAWLQELSFLKGDILRALPGLDGQRGTARKEDEPRYKQNQVPIHPRG